MVESRIMSGVLRSGDVLLYQSDEFSKKILKPLYFLSVYAKVICIVRPERICTREEG